MKTIAERVKALELTVVGITGKKFSGKSTFAREFVANHPFPLRLAFADPLRSVALAVFGSEYRTHEEKDCVDAFWQDRLGDDWSTGRKILQRLGTEVFRDTVSKHLWVDVFERRLVPIIEKVEAGHDKPVIVIDDVRYEEEAECVLAMGGVIVELINPSSPYTKDNHASEKGLPPEMIAHSFVVESEAECRAVSKAFRFCLTQR